MGVFDFKIFYAIYKEALIDDNQTTAVNRLFEPVLKLRFFRANYKDKDDTTPLVIDSRRASEWAADPDRSVRSDVAKFAQTANAVSHIIEHFENVIVPDELDDNKIDQMVKTMAEAVVDSQLNKTQMALLQELLDEQEIGEFLARAFVFSLAPHKGKERKITKKSTESINEFKSLVVDKRKKPKTVVPEKVDEKEAQMGYVQELLDCYGEDSGDEFISPDDVKDTIYEDHFRQQRKSYYSAETIHHSIRDSVTQDDEDFDVLKDEISDGIYYVSHRKYPKGIDKANAVLETAGNVQISNNTDNYMLGWVGPGEKQGVCHMLVNDHRLKWVEEDKDEK